MARADGSVFNWIEFSIRSSQFNQFNVLGNLTMNLNVNKDQFGQIELTHVTWLQMQGRTGPSEYSCTTNSLTYVAMEPYLF